MKSPAPETFGFFTENHGSSAYLRQYAHDAKFVYYYGRRVQGARPETFHCPSLGRYDPPLLSPLTKGIARSI
jgi:hypothetical protein